MHVRVEAELGIDAKVYLLERDGAAFRSFIAEEMSLLDYDIIDCWREGQVAMIKIAAKPDVGQWIPGSLAAKVPEKLEYHDTVAYDPPKLAQAPYELSGYFASRIIIESLGPGRCRHVLEQEIRFKGMWGLGAVAKKLAKKSLEQSFADMPAIIDRWVRVREELLETPHGRQRLLAGRPKIQGDGSTDGRPTQQQRKHPAHQPGEHHQSVEAKTPTARHRTEAASQPAGKEPAVAAPPLPTTGHAEEEAVPPSPFAAAAAAAPKHARGAATSAAQHGQQPASAEDSGRAVEAAAPAVSGPDEEEFQDAPERLGTGRQSTGETVYLSPATSLEASASHEPPAPAPAAGAAIGAGWPEAGQRLVHAQRVTAAGEPLPAAGAGNAEDSKAGSSASSASDESEDWSKTAAWRDYFSQHGLQPLRRQHTLPAPLVLKFIAVRRPQPVSAQRLTPGAASGSGKRGRRIQNKLKSMCAPCLGRANTAAAE